MLIIPAIDIKNGCVVRLRQGKFSREKAYSRDPLETAKRWAAQGAELIHIVDLDGAKTGVPKNLAVVKEIARRSSSGIEFGGGVRGIAAIKTLLGSGIKRVVLGTKAIEDERFLKKAFGLFKHRVIVSIDAKKQKILTEGWKKGSARAADVLEFALYLKGLGFKELIYTDTLKDGMLSGPNIKAIKELLKKSGMRVIASGGVSCIKDIDNLKALEKNGLCGVIIGKALYEGKFTLREALSRG